MEAFSKLFTNQLIDFALKDYLHILIRKGISTKSTICVNTYPIGLRLLGGSTPPPNPPISTPLYPNPAGQFPFRSDPAGQFPLLSEPAGQRARAGAQRFGP